jgi:hypothetical protein
MSTTARVQQVAADLAAQGISMKTADQAPRPAPKPPAVEPAKTRDKRSPEWWKAFHDVSPVALTVWGHYAPVPRGFGDNHGVLPVKIGTSGRWVSIEKLGLAGDRFHAQYAYGIWFRVWALDLESANGLAYALTNVLAESIRGRELTHHEQMMAREIRSLQRSEAWLRNGHIDLTPDFDIPFIDTERMRKHLELPKAETQEQAREQHYAVIQGKLEAFAHHLAGDNCIQAWDDEGFAAHVDAMIAKHARREMRRERR